MLRPLDIQNKEFKRGFRGYKEIQVDTFLDKIISDYELLFKENREHKSVINMLREQIKSHNCMEDTLQKTLIVAQNTSEEVIQTARQQEESIIADAERRSARVMEAARDQVIDSQKEYQRLRKEISVFKNKYRSLLNAQLETIDNYSQDNVFSVLDDMKEKDFKLSKGPEVEVKVEAETEQQEISQTEENLADQETLTGRDPIPGRYAEEDNNDNQDLNAEDLKNDEDEQMDDLSDNTKRPILD